MKRVALAAVVALGAFGLVMMRGPAPTALSTRTVSSTSSSTSSISSVAAMLAVPLASDAPLLDGALHEAAWRDTDARSGAFVVGTEPTRPHSDARFVRTADTLWVGLYAADQDIRGADFFRVTLGARVVTVTARCAIASPGSTGAVVRAACDVDGTLDDQEEDEEWTVELAFPLVGLADSVPIIVERCEVGEPTQAAPCGRFTATLALR